MPVLFALNDVCLVADAMDEVADFFELHDVAVIFDFDAALLLVHPNVIDAFQAGSHVFYADGAGRAGCPDQLYARVFVFGGGGLYFAHIHNYMKKIRPHKNCNNPAKTCAPSGCTLLSFGVL